MSTVIQDLGNKSTSQPPAVQKPKPLYRVREAIRVRHYSRRTEEAYIHWSWQYLFPASTHYIGHKDVKTIMIYTH